MARIKGKERRSERELTKEKAKKDVDTIFKSITQEDKKKAQKNTQTGESSFYKNNDFEGLTVSNEEVSYIGRNDRIDENLKKTSKPLSKDCEVPTIEKKQPSRTEKPLINANEFVLSEFENSIKSPLYDEDLSQSRTHLDKVITKNAREIVFGLLNRIAEKFRNLFVEFATDWVKKNATIEEARKFEVVGKFKRESLKENKPDFKASSIKINRSIYVERQWWEGGKPQSEQLGKIIVDEKENTKTLYLKREIDFSKSYISPDTLRILEDAKIIIS
jgi:hypothetical protein